MLNYILKAVQCILIKPKVHLVLSELLVTEYEYTSCYFSLLMCTFVALDKDKIVTESYPNLDLNGERTTRSAHTPLRSAREISQGHIYHFCQICDRNLLVCDRLSVRGAKQEMVIYAQQQQPKRSKCSCLWFQGNPAGEKCPFCPELTPEFVKVKPEFVMSL